jgi:PhzF family phenazine biosynthesis protein
MTRRFKQIDVFADDVCLGNPLAVVLDAAGLDDAELQRFAAWTNLSETTFLLPPTHPEADYRVRIFTTTTELPFAGHPTLGSCHAWREAGGVPKRTGTVMQECGLGLIAIREEAGRYAFAAPARRRSGPLDDALLQRLLRGLNLTRDEVLGHEWLVNGPQWIGLRLRSAEAVLALKPDFAQLKGLDFGVVGAHPAGHPQQFEVRAFSFVDGPVEDPVTGSLNAAIAQWLIGANIAPPRYIATQGTVLGRAGRVHITRDDQGDIWVGGAARTVIDGSVDLTARRA